MGVVAEEVDELAGGVDLGLVEVLALAQHRSGVHQGAVLGGDEFRDLEQDGGADRPVGLGPLLVGGHGGVDGHPDLGRTGLVVSSQHVLMVVRHDHFARVARTDFLAADDQRDFDFNGTLAFELLLEGLALGGSFQVGFDRLVGRIRKCIDRVSHIVMICV